MEALRLIKELEWIRLILNALFRVVRLNIYIYINVLEKELEKDKAHRDLLLGMAKINTRRPRDNSLENGRISLPKTLNYSQRRSIEKINTQNVVIANRLVKIGLYSIFI